jgi:phosphoglycerate dehydrogenase-like enzyme
MRILLASGIDPGALAELRRHHDVISAPEARLMEQAIDREAIIFRSGTHISRDLLDAAPRLRWLIRAGSGGGRSAARADPGEGGPRPVMRAAPVS